MSAMSLEELHPDTIHFGGGTPSLLEEKEWRAFVASLSERIDWQCAREIAIEVDPADLTDRHLSFWSETGVNRISLGVQSFDDDVLQRMNRQHDGAQAVRAVEMIRQSTVENLNIDLMYGMPGRSLKSWQGDLDAVVALGASSVTCYATRPNSDSSIENAKAFPSDAERLVAHEMATNQLMKSGYFQYSPNQYIRNYSGACLAKNNRNRCKDVLGLGPHAHSIIQGWFYEGVAGVDSYRSTIKAGQLCALKGERIVGDEERRRFLQFGIKLSGLGKPVLDNGVFNSDYAKVFGNDIANDFGQIVDQLSDLKLIEDHQGEALVLSHAGVLLADDVVKYFSRMESE
jgi:oxygen-independent coproporphyrinogen-3 oxidase